MKVVFGNVEKKRNNVLKVLDVEGRLARLGLKEQKANVEVRGAFRRGLLPRQGDLWKRPQVAT